MLIRGSSGLSSPSVLLAVVYSFLYALQLAVATRPKFTESVYYTEKHGNISNGTLVATVAATDGGERTLKYSILDTGSSSMKLVDGVFSIDPSSGEIRTHALLSDIHYWFVMNVTATNGVSTGYASVVMKVNYGPVSLGIHPKSLSIQENAAMANGTNIRASHSIAGKGRFVFSIASVTSTKAFTGVPTTTFGLFNLHQTDLDSAYLNASQPLDADKYISHNISLHVTAVESPAIRTQASVIVTVQDLNDNAPTFESNMYSVVISEGLGVGDRVTTVRATDGDVSAPHNSLSAYVLQNGSKVFNISPQGVVSLLQPFDYYSQQQYTVEVQVQDQGSPSLTGTAAIQITVSLNQPCFTNTTTTVFVEGTRSQALSPSLTLGCRSRATTVARASITLPANPSCPGQNLCQLTERLPACELDETNFPVYRLMDLARGKFTNSAAPPADAACQSTAVTLVQVSGVLASAELAPGTIPNLAAGDNFTISARVRLFSALEHKEMLFSVNKGGRTRFIAVYLIDADLGSRTAATDPFNNLWVYYQTSLSEPSRHVEFQNVLIYDQQFHNIIVTVSDSTQTMSLYVDCQHIQTQSMTGRMIWDSTQPLHIGTRDGSDKFALHGVIDDLIIQQRLWTQENINCMCSDSPTPNCGETIERPHISTALTSVLENNGRRLTLTGMQGFDVYESALRSVVYRYIAPIIIDEARNVTFVFDDVNGNSGSNLSSISIIDTNNNIPPTVLLNGVVEDITVVYDEGVRGSLTLVPSVRLDDRDDANLASATVALVGQDAAAGEVLGYDSTVAASSFITVSVAPDLTNITFTATGIGRPIANFQAVLRTVTYAVTGAPSTLSGIPQRTVLFAITGTDTGFMPSTSITSVLTINIQVSSNRNAPTITGVVSPLTQQMPTTNLTSVAVVNDADVQPLARSITLMITQRPPSLSSNITGLVCERFAPLVKRATTCTGRSDIMDLLEPAPVATSPLTVSSTPDGNVAFFTGLDFHLTIPSANHDLTGFDLSTFTVSVWFRQTRLVPRNQGYIMTLTDVSGENRFINIYSRADINEVWVRVPQGTDTTFLQFNTGTGVLDNGDWHHLVVSFVNPLVTVYLDGNLLGSQNSTVVGNLVVPANYLLYVGGRPRVSQTDTALFRFAGEIAGLQFWRGGFTPAQISCYRLTCLPSLGLSAAAPASVTATYTESSRMLQLLGSTSVTLSDLQTALRQVQYTNENTVSGSRTITYTASDTVISTTTMQVLNML